MVEDTEQPEQNKRWAVVLPPNSNEKQQAFIGQQSGGRVFLFLQTDDFERDVRDMREKGIEFVREPQTQPYGKVAVFSDLYGNLWDSTLVC